MIGALACVGALGASATGALATGTTTPAAGLAVPFGPLGSVPSSCPTSITPTGFASFLFTSGNAVSYGTSDVRNGGNAEGTAYFQEDGTSLYQGHLHAWFGTTQNAQGQFYTGETLSFQGTSLSDPSQSLTVTASGGETIAAHKTTPTGWGHFKITCS